jgi:hypothetical protein
LPDIGRSRTDRAQFVRGQKSTALVAHAVFVFPYLPIRNLGSCEGVPHFLGRQAMTGRGLRKTLQPGEVVPNMGKSGCRDLNPVCRRGGRSSVIHSTACVWSDPVLN